MRVARLAFLLALALPARAQAPSPGAGDGLGLFDGRGGFYSVANRRAGTAFIQVTKLSGAGAWLWNLPYNPGVDVSASALAVDREGNLLIAGTVKDGNHRDILVLKYTANGNLHWRQTYEAGGNAVPTVVGADDDGNLFVAATVSEPAGSHLRVLRYGPSGALFWGQVYRGGRTNYARSLLVDRSGHADLTVEVTVGDARQGYYQTRQVMFTSYGAVVQK